MLKTMVISALLLGCFLMMMRIAPSLLTNTNPKDETSNRKLSPNQLNKSIITLVMMVSALVLILHYWR